MAGAEEKQANQACGDGHVEGVSQIPRSSQSMRQGPPFCSISSMSCDISATPWTKCENASTGGWLGKDRRFIKGQKYTLLSHRENLSTEGRRQLKAIA